MVQQFYGVIYLITCKVNGKQYVGQTVQKDPLRYIQGHFNAAQNGKKKLLYRAIRKHGADNFTLEIIWWASDRTSLDISEDSFIELFETMAPNGYNLRGGGFNGRFSDELKRQHSRILTIALSKPGISLKLSEAQKIAQNRPGVWNDQRRLTLKISLNLPDVKTRQIAGCIEFANTLEGRAMKVSAANMRWSHEGSREWRISMNLQINHNRWHVRRGKKSPDCPLCNAQDEELEI